MTENLFQGKETCKLEEISLSDTWAYPNLNPKMLTNPNPLQILWIYEKCIYIQII